MLQSGKKLDDEQLKKVSGGRGQEDVSASADEDRGKFCPASGSDYMSDREWTFDLSE